MSLRSIVVIASAAALGLLFVSAATPGKDRTPPTTPTGLRITATTSTSVTLAWNKSTDNSGKFWYCVQQSFSGCYRVDPPQTTFTRPTLMPNAALSFSVYAVDAAGNRSGNSNSVTYTTPPDTTPPSPTPSVSLVSVYPTRISVAWTKAKDNLSQVFYSLFVDGSPYFANQIGTQGATLLDLMPGTTHTFQVTARDASGNSVQSNVLTVTTPAATDTTPPSAPTNLALSSESASPEIWLDWTQSTDDTDPQSLILYDAYRNGILDHAAMGTGETLTYCPGFGLTTVVLRAVDTSGNVSAPSNTITFNC